MCEHLPAGLFVALERRNLLVVLLSTMIGIWIGVIPGLGPAMAMAILFPFTFAMEPLPGLLMLASIHVAGAYGGSVSAILINIPGDPASAATTFDGYALARRGQARVALGMSLAASAFGATAGVLALILAAQPLVDVALRVGPPEFFALAILGLCVVAELTQLMVRGGAIADAGAPSGRILDGVRMTLRYPLSLLRGVAAGIFVGVVPGIGAVTASLLVYMMEKRVSRRPETFGQGAPEGVVAPEAANNACLRLGRTRLRLLRRPARRRGDARCCSATSCFSHSSSAQSGGWIAPGGVVVPAAVSCSVGRSSRRKR